MIGRLYTLCERRKITPKCKFVWDNILTYRIEIETNFSISKIIDFCNDEPESFLHLVFLVYILDWYERYYL